MTSNSMESWFLEVFPCLGAVSPKEWTEAQPFVKRFPAKTRIFQKEDAAIYGMFLLRGTAHISQIRENGNEEILTVLSAGEVCALLVLSGLSNRDYPGSIVAVSDVEALFVLKSSFLRWTLEHDAIRKVIFSGLLDGMLRMSELLRARQSEPLEERLARALLRATSETQPLFRTTHQALAAEISSAREVVTRALQRFQIRGWVETGRGWVRIAQRNELEAQLGDLVTEGRDVSC
jgi:CRP/FNR family transcriptional regulator